MTRSTRSADGERGPLSAATRRILLALCVAAGVGMLDSPALARGPIALSPLARHAGHGDGRPGEQRGKGEQVGCPESAARAAQEGSCEGLGDDDFTERPTEDDDDGGPPPPPPLPPPLPPPPPPAPSPALTLSLLEQDLTTHSGLSHTATLAVSTGDSLAYVMQVTNSGNVALTDVGLLASLCTPVAGPFTDAAGTALLHGVLLPGASAFFTCARTVAPNDPSPLINAAQGVARTTDLRHSVTSNPDSVGAVVAPHQVSMTVSSYEQDLSLPGSALGQGPITVRVGDLISYQVVVQNGGGEALTLSLHDSACPTTVGPSASPGGPLLAGAILAPHAAASFTCTHAVLASDGPWLVNTATVTGIRASAGPLTVTTAVLAGVLAASLPGVPGAGGRPRTCAMGPIRFFSENGRTRTRLLVSGRNLASVTFQSGRHTLAILRRPNGSGGRYVIILSGPRAGLHVTAVLRGRCGAVQIRKLTLASPRHPATRHR